MGFDHSRNKERAETDQDNLLGPKSDLLGVHHPSQKERKKERNKKKKKNKRKNFQRKVNKMLFRGLKCQERETFADRCISKHEKTVIGRSCQENNRSKKKMNGTDPTGFMYHD